MKKFIVYLLAVSILCAAFVSCGSDTGAENSGTPDNPAAENIAETAEVDIAASELAEKILAAYPEEDVPSLYTFLYGAADDSDNYLEPDRAGMFFTGEYGNVPEAFGNQTDFAYLIPTGYYVFEIDVIRSGDAKAAEELLKLRLAQKNNGDIEQYRPEELPQLEDAEIFSVGSYTFLISTKDNAAAHAVIDELLGK